MLQILTDIYEILIFGRTKITEMIWTYMDGRYVVPVHIIERILLRALIGVSDTDLNAHSV